MLPRTWTRVFLSISAFGLVTLAKSPTTLLAQSKTAPTWDSTAETAPPKIKTETLSKSGPVALSGNELKTKVQQSTGMTLGAAASLRSFEVFVDAEEVIKEKGYSSSNSLDGKSGEEKTADTDPLPQSETLIVPDGCSMSKVEVPGIGWFLPLKPFESSSTRLTGVSDTGMISGYYLDSSFAIKPLRVAVTSGGTATATTLSLAASGGTLEQGWALGVSDDGAAIVGAGCLPGKCSCSPGRSPSGDQETPPSFETCSTRAARWAATGTAAPTMLSALGGAAPPPTNALVQSEATDAGDLGASIVGNYRQDQGLLSIQATRWVNNGPGAAILPQVTNQTEPYACDINSLGICDVRVEGISRDGSCVAGTFLSYEAAYNYEPGYRAFRHCGSTSSIPTLLPRVSGAPTATNIPARARGRGISSDGKAVVGGDINGSSLSRFSFPAMINPTYNVSNLLPINAQTLQLEEAFRWRPAGIGTNGGQAAKYGDLLDSRGPSGTNLIDSRFYDTSRGGCRSVGESYGGGDAVVSGSERFRSAVIRPALSGGDTQLAELKSSLLLHRTLDIDAANPVSATLGRRVRWQLIDATGISADGRYIVGTAVCEGRRTSGAAPLDSTYYGYVVRLNDQACTPQ